MNVIGDIAGQYSSLMRLIEKMPKQKTILLGDLNDRGWQSKEVIQWAIDNDVYIGGLVQTIDSNHGDLFIDWYYQKTSKNYEPRYDDGVFFGNGGRATVSSYGIDFNDFDITKQVMDNEVMNQHIEWLAIRPSHIKTEVNGQKYLFTHAPLNTNPHRTLEQFFDIGDGFASKPFFFKNESEDNYQWNRHEPDRFHHELPDTISVFGHNSGKSVKVFCEQYQNGIYCASNDMLQNILDINKGQVYGICLDTSRDAKLCGLDLNKMEFYHENY